MIPFVPILVLFFFVNVAAAESHGEIEYTMRAKKIDCIDKNPKLCGNILCDLKVVSRTEIVVNLGCDVQRELKEMTFAGAIFMKIGTNYRIFGPFFSVDFCEALKMRKNILLNSVFKQVEEKNSHVLHDCPFKGPTYIRNMTINEAFGLSALPQGDYRIEARLSETKTNATVIHTRMYFYIKATDPLKDFKNAFVEMKFS